MQRSWNEGQSVAALKAMERSLAEGLDPDTKRRLQRLSMIYFWASVGMERDRAAEPKLNAAPGEERPPCLRAGESPRRV